MVDRVSTKFPFIQETKMKKLLLIPIFVLFLLSFVNADVSRTFYFKDSSGNDLTNVNYLIYTCLDASCSNVKVPDFTNGRNFGNSDNYPPNNDGEIVFPTSLETSYGYALYFYKNGYLPMEYFDDDRGNGYVQSTINFEKKAQCSAPIDHIEVLNDVRPNIPLVIKVPASLDADTYSALHSNSNTPAFIPAEYNDFYSALTKVTLTVYKKSDLNSSLAVAVYSESKIVNIFMDSSQSVEFTWTPTLENDYVAKITTDVIDNKCSSSKTNTASAEFKVHESVPQNACYTILNRPGTSNPIDAEVGELITITGDKSSYYIDNYQNIEPVESKVFIEIYNSAGVQFFEQTKGVFNFEWTPTEAGDYTIKVEGIATDPKCNGISNYPSQTLTIPLTIYPKTTPTEQILELKFIPNQAVNEGSELSFFVTPSYYNGNQKIEYSVENLPNGAAFEPVYGQQVLNYPNPILGYEFTWTPDYNVVSHETNFIDTIKIFITNYFTNGKQCRNNGKCEFKLTFKASAGSLNAQQEVIISVKDVNRLPHVVNPIGPIIVTEGDLVKIVPRNSFTDLDFDKLTYSYTSPLNQNGEWQTRVGDAGEYISIIIASDGMAEATQEILIKVLPKYTEPVEFHLSLNDIPSQEIKLGQKVEFTISAQYDGSNELTFSAENKPEGAAFNNQLFTWVPGSLGNYNIIFKVTDGVLESKKTAVVTVTEEARALRATKHDIGIERVIVNSMKNVVPGEYFPVTVFATNFAGLKEKDVRVTISLPELNQIQYSSSFDLNPKEVKTQTFMFKLPVNTDRKQEVIAVTVSNNKDTETKYFFIDLKNQQKGL